MATPLPEDLGRLGYWSESAFKTQTGSVTNLGGLMALDTTADRNSIAVPIQRNGEKDGKADEPGYQGGSIAFETNVTDLFGTQHGDLVKCSMGAEVGAVTLPSFSAGTTADVTCSGSTTFDQVLKVPAVDGNTYYVPVKSVTSTKATFAFLLTSAANAKPKNASETSGRAFSDSKFGTVTTFEFRRDQAGATGETWEKYQGCAPKAPFKLQFAPGGLLKIRWEFEPAIWTLSTSAGTSGLSDASDNTEAYVADVISCGIQDIGTPAALTALGVKALELSCGYGFSARMGGQGISGTAVPGSNKTGWVRRNSGDDIISVTIDDGNWKTWDDARVAKTSYFFWVEFAPGVPSGTAGSSRLCIFKPKVKVKSAKPVKVDGLQCTALELQVERASSLSLVREYVSFFGTS